MSLDSGETRLALDRSGAPSSFAEHHSPGGAEPGDALGWNVPPQLFSWGAAAAPDAASRTRNISLGEVGSLYFKSVQDARGCKIDSSPGAKGAEDSTLTLEPAADGQRVRLLLPLTVLSCLDGLPLGASATFSVSLRLSGTLRTKPLEWIALLAKGSDQSLYFWRKIAQEVDASEPYVGRWYFSATVGQEGTPSEVYLAVQLHPDSGPVTFGPIEVALDSIATEGATLDVASKSGVKGWFRSADGSTNAWLHACVGSAPLVRLRVSPDTDLFKITPEAGLVRFGISQQALARALSGGNREWRLVLTEHGTAVAQANVTVAAHASINAGLPGGARGRAAAIEYLRTADDKTLASVLREVRNGEVLSRARSHFKAQNWAGLLSFHRVLLGVSKEYQRLLTLVGRSALYANDHQVATRLLGMGAATFPSDEEMQYYCGVAHTRGGQHLEAIPYFRAALRLRSSAARTKKALATALRRASRDAALPRTRIDMIGEAARLLREVLDQEFDRSSAVSLVELLGELGRNEEALQMVDQLLAEGHRDLAVLLLKVRNLVALNRVGEALTIAEEIIKIDPLNHSARFHLRALRFLADGAAPTRPTTFGDLIRLPSGDLLVGPLGETGTPLAPRPTNAADLAAALSRLPFDWMRIVDGEGIAIAAADLAAAVDSSCGFCEHKRAAEPPTKLWRREAMILLAESGLISPDLSDLAPFEAIYRRSRSDPGEAPTAIVISRHGSLKFGGGEHFIESMAEHYRSIGYDPIIVGTRPELVGDSGEANGFRFAFIDQSATALRRFLLQSKAQLVHAISGLGFPVTEALSYTNIPFIYGVHFWREALGGGNDQGYFDGDGRPVPRPEFLYVLSRASSVYANSQYTRSVLETAYGVRCPVIYSVPREVEDHHDA